jgi:hypothetical protein
VDFPAWHKFRLSPSTPRNSKSLRKYARSSMGANHAEVGQFSDTLLKLTSGTAVTSNDQDAQAPASEYPSWALQRDFNSPAELPPHLSTRTRNLIAATRQNHRSFSFSQSAHCVCFSQSGTRAFQTSDDLCVARRSAELVATDSQRH